MAKAQKVYVHVLDWNDELLALPKMAKIKSASTLHGATKVEFHQQASGVTVRIPAAARDAIDTILVLEMSQ